MDLCIESNGTQCFSSQYKDLSFNQQSTILGMKDTSLNDFVTWWSQTVADNLGLDAATIQDAYSSSKYSVDSNSRVFLKYAWSKGVFGTPTAFINGVMLDTVPTTTQEWMLQLKAVYFSQFRASQHEEEEYLQ